MSRAVQVAWWLACTLACGACERAVDAPASEPGATVAPPASAVHEAPAPAPATAHAAAPSAGADAELRELLNGGPALTELPLRATDEGTDFDPKLRSKLAPTIKVRESHQSLGDPLDEF